MEGYLGETPVDISVHPHLSAYTQADWAMLFITKYGQTEGARHKAWVLDTVSQILKGTPVVVTEARWANGQSELRYALGEPSQAYQDWREHMLARDSHGIPQYGYDAGRAP